MPGPDHTTAGPARSLTTDADAAMVGAMSHEPRTLRVSQATARILARGHPWVLPDRDTGSLAGLKAGDRVRLRDRSGRDLALALADPGSRVVARVVGRPEESFEPRARALAALRRRADLLERADTDVVRLVHGEADGLPGLFVDRYGDALVAVRQARCAAPWCGAVYDVLCRELDLSAVWEKDHFDDLRRASVRGRAVRGVLDENAEVEVREAGLTVLCRPFGGLATGIYPDQRDNRAQLVEAGPFPRVLNLFAYTGVFSLAMLVAGAARAVDVDLAAPALRTARRNRALNGLPSACHHTRKADAVAFTRAQADASFDLVIVDPPVSARGGKGWYVDRSYGPLLDDVLRVLAPGGTLLACLNRRGARPDQLRRQVRERAAACGREIRSGHAAPPALDHPVMEGFAESRMFQGFLARLR